ncbi:MAG: hypothetical protein GXP35_12160 [Actinobacteria bacterium]|nr:hypothetical protein [Actinomycetota bacterium]
MTQLWGGQRVPVTFLSGYLGAGKTSLLNHLLATADRRLAVMVNDVGDIAVDAALLARRTDGVIELTNGCVCCSLTDGFISALDEIRSRPRPDHVVIELSGVADPARVTAWASTAGFRLDGVVTLADVDQLHDRWSQPRTQDTVERQLRVADLLVRTKLDLASADSMAAANRLLATFGDGAAVVDAVDGALDANVVLGVHGSERTIDVADDTPAVHVVSTLHPHLADRASLALWIEDLPPTVVRAKGVVACTDGTRWRLDVVGRRHRVVAESSNPSAQIGVVTIAVPT